MYLTCIIQLVLKNLSILAYEEIEAQGGEVMFSRSLSWGVEKVGLDHKPV